MVILFRQGRIAYGRDNGRCCILTGFVQSGNRYTCDTCDELPEQLCDLIGPIDGAANAQQRRIILAAAEVYRPDRVRSLPVRDREALIMAMMREVEQTPDPIRHVLHMLNLQHPLIAKLEREYRIEQGIPTHDCPFTTRERVAFELDAISRLMEELRIRYPPPENQSETV